MELQCGEFEARSKKIKSKNLTVKQYLHFFQTHKQSDLTVDHLNKIISIHGFKMLHKVKKEVMIDAVGSIELMDLTRSTLEDDNISSFAFVTSEEAIKDLMCLNWMECSITSFKTLNSANYDLMNLQNAKTVALKSKSMKRKPPKMRRINDGMEPTRSLACGDQCAAKGSASDCAVVDHLSSTSLLANLYFQAGILKMEHLERDLILRDREAQTLRDEANTWKNRFEESEMEAAELKRKLLLAEEAAEKAKASFWPEFKDEFLRSAEFAAVLKEKNEVDTEANYRVAWDDALERLRKKCPDVDTSDWKCPIDDSEDEAEDSHIDVEDEHEPTVPRLTLTPHEDAPEDTAEDDPL